MEGSVLREGVDVAIIACGVMVEQALIAADSLSDAGINATVVDMHTIKPLDTGLVSRLAESCGCFVSAEDHSVIGGLGGSIAEWLSSNNPCHLEMVGVQDRFGESGESDELMGALKITSVEIVAAAQRVIGRKNTP